MARAATIELPTGTVTFLFTDIEGSTRVLQTLGDRYRDVLADHAELIRHALATHDGTEVSTEGDAFFAVFRSPADAVAAAADTQRALAGHAWPDDAPIRVRMGLHTGEGALGGDNYAGIDVNRAARIAAAGHGGQVLLSEATHGLVARSLPDGVGLRDLGAHRLKDLEHPEHLFQLAITGLPDRFPPPRTVDIRRTNLPAVLSSFVGRESEIGDVSRLLGQARLLTLTGPGGTGKTRLGLEVALRQLDQFVDGVYFVALDAIRDPGLVPSAIAQTLGVREEGRSVEEAVTQHLARKRLLLVLDNFEQILPAAPLIERLLMAAPELRALVTSRVPLQIHGEQEYGVAPLRVPDPAARPVVEELSRYEAVALFMERARGVNPGFAITDDNAIAVAEISVRLDGLPLAIELAAARVKLLSPQAILARLGRRLELLSSRSPSLPARQRSLRAAIDWSWELLAEGEQRLFERLSVFSGGWDLPAAEAVCGADPGIDLLEGLASLLDKSLVRRGDGPEPRFTMLQTIQEYARERLAARGEALVVARRHAAYFRDLAEAAEPAFVGPDPARSVKRLLPEQDNLRAALEWAIATGEAEAGLRLAAAVWRFWQERGQLREGRRWLDNLLALPGADGATSIRARGLTAAGGIAYWQGDEAARAYYEEALAIYRSLEDAQGIADSLQNLAFTVLVSQREEGMELFRESLARYRELNDERNIASVVGALGYAQMMAGRYDDARSALEEAVALNLAHGVRGRANDNQFALGHLHRLTGDLPTAAAHYRTTLLDVRAMGDASRMLMQLRAISAYAFAAGGHENALRLAGAIERAREAQGGTIGVPLPGVTDPVEEARAARAMSDAEIAEALAAGRAMDLQEAVDFALSLLGAHRAMV